MSKKVKIIIEVDPDNEKIFVVDNAGNVVELAGIMVVGGKPKKNLQDDDRFYLFDWGSSTAAAWAYGRGYLVAHTNKHPRYNSLKNFYMKCAQEIAKLEKPAITEDLMREHRERRTIDFEELIEKLLKRERAKKREDEKLLH